MQPLRIDFLRRRPPASLLGWALMLVGVVGMAVAALDYAQAREELQSTLDRAERQARSAKTRPRSAAPAPASGVLAASARVGSAVAPPWGRLLRELEQLADPGVALLGIEAQGASRQMRITGEARTMPEVIAYLESLRRSPLSSSVVLGSHELIMQDGVPVIRFSLDMAWGESS
ncbi:MAG: PilN domain-containing protein [Pseudomonadota bacterium]